MAFLNPLLLGGLALGSVPVIIHLLNKRRFRPVQWAAMEFLLQAIQKNSRRLQLRDLILMLIRTAAILFLALALARPTIAGQVGFLGGRSSTAAIILIDNSYSMGYHNGRETRFDVAKRLAKEVLSRLDAGAWCGVYTFNEEPDDPLGEPSQQLAYLEQEIDKQLFLSDGTTGVERALLHVRDKIFKQHREYVAAAKELYIITDRQARSWDPRNVSSTFGNVLKDLSEQSAVFLIDAGDLGGENVAILDLAPSDRLVTIDTRVNFVVKLKNFGTVPVDGLYVDFFVDPTGAGDERPVERKAVNLREGEVTTVEFDAAFSTGGDHKIEVRLGEGADRLAGDNRRYLTVEVTDDMRFLLVDGKELNEDNPRATETGYLRYALAPVDFENPDQKPLVVAEAVPHYRVADKNLSNYGAVVLCNVEKLIPAVTQQLERQVRSGMGLLVFLGDQNDAQRVNAIFGEEGLKLLPAVVGEPWGREPKVGDEELPEAVGIAGEADKLSHPIMADFNLPEARPLVDMLKVYKAFELKPVPGDDVQTVAWFADGRPAILERKVGSGSVILCAFPATTAWSNLPTQPAFPIMMLRAASRLSIGQRPDKNQPVGADLFGFLSLADLHAKVKIAAPPPVGRREADPVDNHDGRARFDFAETQKGGFYEIRIDRAGFKPLVYSLNAEAEVESDLTAVSPEQIQKDYPGFEFAYIAQNDDLEHALKSEKEGTEIWPWFMALVFLMLAAESILAYLWAPRD